MSEKKNKSNGGPDALMEWVRRWHPGFRAAYRQALRDGYRPTVVVWAMPHTDRVEDPPIAVDFATLAEARQRMHSISSMATGLDNPAPAGASGYRCRPTSGWRSTNVCGAKTPRNRPLRRGRGG